MLNLTLKLCYMWICARKCLGIKNKFKNPNISNILFYFHSPDFAVSLGQNKYKFNSRRQNNMTGKKFATQKQT